MRKLKLLLATLTLLVGGVSTASAGTDVTASYVGDLNAYSQGGWSGSCENNHKESNGIGWWNTQTGLSGGHSFRDGESWCPNVGSAGVMLGRTMVLPAGNYTLSFSAYGATTNNATDKTVPEAGDIKAFFSGSETKYDVTNTTLDDATYHNVSYTFDVTTDNTAYTFGVEKMSDGSKANWARIKDITLTLNSTNITPIANNSIESFTYSLADEESKDTWHTNTWSTEGQSDGTRFQVPFHELWKTSGGELLDATITGTYTPTVNGVYKVSAWVRAMNEAGGEISGIKIFVGDVETDACAGSSVRDGKGRLGTFTAMADGVSGTPFNYGFKIKEATLNWLSFKNVTITYYAEMPEAEKTALLALVPTGKMNATIQSTLKNYATAFQANASVANYNALSLYIPTAKASADIYEAINTAIGDYATKASALDAAGQAAYDASAIQTKYNDGTYTTLAEAEADLSAALIAAIKVQTSENSDWTGLIVNPSFESDFSNGWTNTGMARQNNTSFAKTGTYYAEKWEPNGTFSVKQTIKDLPAGVYSISAKALARSVTSAKLFAADSEQDITIGEDSGDYTVKFLQEADGDLTFGFEGVGDGTVTSWLCVDNFTMKFVHAAPIAVTIAASGYSTIASASALDCANLPDGLKAYKVSSISASAVTLEEVKTAVAAGTGLVLNGTASTAYAIPVVASGTDISATNKLKAAVTATEVAANAAYVLKGGKFCLVNAASTVPAGKAYLLASDVPASARDLSIIFDGGATAIDGVAVSESNNGAVYNLQGQRVTKAQKGLYIQNGKKVLK